MKGRKPKPTHLKIVGGNAGKRKLNASEPTPEGDLCDPPDWLTEDQAVGWKYAIQHSPNGLLKNLDRSALVVWVVAEDLHRQASVAVAKFGLVTKSPVKGDPMQNPYLAIVNRQATIMMKAAAELGFTPSSRSRVAIDGSNGKEDPADRFFSRSN
jgi:P27 family predicted phage terminase small subunit